MSGSVDWPEGDAVMDMPQMHLPEFEGDPTRAAQQVDDWTLLIWDREEKPNWIGEYGDRGQQTYPEMMHNANWAALAAGAAMTPIEWNDGHGYGAFDQPMQEDMARFATADHTVRSGVVATIDSLAVGPGPSPRKTPGAGSGWNSSRSIALPTPPCVVALPDFSRDQAFKLSHT